MIALASSMLTVLPWRMARKDALSFAETRTSGTTTSSPNKSGFLSAPVLGTVPHTRLFLYLTLRSFLPGSQTQC